MEDARGSFMAFFFGVRRINKLNIVDMFCGGGGESTGLIEAAHEYNFDINMSAINHWERAIETHSQNYPFAEHRCKNVQHNEPNTLSAATGFPKDYKFTGTKV